MENRGSNSTRRDSVEIVKVVSQPEREKATILPVKSLAQAIFDLFQCFQLTKKRSKLIRISILLIFASENW